MALPDTSGQDRPRPRPTQSVERALALLDALGRVDHALTLTEVTAEAGLHVSTGFRLLRTLEHAGYVARDGAGAAYRLGPRIFTLAHALERQFDIRTVARPILGMLTEATNEMSSLTVLLGKEVMLLERATSQNQLGFMAGVGARSPLYCTAAGKCLLAYANPALVEQVLAEPLEPRTPTTITDPARLRAELERIRSSGHAIDDCEREPGLFGIAAPVRDARGQVVATVGVSGPAERIKTPALPETIDLLRQAADNLSDKLSWVSPVPTTNDRHLDAARVGPSLSGEDSRA